MKDLRLYGTVVRRVCNGKLPNVVTDILASNVRYERPIVSNRNVATTTEPPTADTSDDSGSSVEEEQDNIREIDFAATVNWQSKL